MHVYNWIILLYSRNQLSIVNQPYLNNLKKKKKTIWKHILFAYYH